MAFYCSENTGKPKPWFLVNDQRDAQITFYVFISIYNSLHFSSAQCSSSGETIISIQPLVTVYVVTEMCAG